MAAKKRNIVEWAMHYRQIVIMITCCLMALGIWGLDGMKKNEFPDFTIREGIVAAVAPGYTATEIEEQVAKPLEDYIFTYKEVKKSKTQTICKDGMAVIQVCLNDELQNKDEFWSKFRHGVSQFKNQLPTGVLAIQVMDDFGDTSALLVSMESKDKTYRELDQYMDGLKDRLRTIEDVGRMTVYGMCQEQISVCVDTRRLSHYGISEKAVAMDLFANGFATSAGRLKNDSCISPIYVKRSLNSVHDIREMIVLSTPEGNVVRLKDIAHVEKEYPDFDSYITNNGEKCLLLSVEMKKGRNIVKMGNEVNEVLSLYETTLPEDVAINKITDQSQVVGDSVSTFLFELVIAIVAVVAVVLLLLPMRVALVAASTIPITIFISLALFYMFGIELNTVTLAALIVTLGMIVDNSIVIIDSYLEMLTEGYSRWHASIHSATHFFKSIFSATLAISITFFPFLFTTKGMVADFLVSFPWAITLILAISLIVAELLVPFMQYCFIRKPLQQGGRQGKKNFSFLDMLQRSYDKLIDWCFGHPKTVLAGGVLSVAAGIWIFALLPQQMMPTAERNQFAVEIYCPTGTSVEQTTMVADSLERVLRTDKRVVSVTSFKGCSSPRFSNSYAPVMGGSNFAQFIVNTTDDKATVEVLDEYAPKWNNVFPDANVRFKQLGYSEAVYPIEVRISGENLDVLAAYADTIASIMRQMPQLQQVHSSTYEPQVSAMIDLKGDAATRLGISNAAIESSLAMRYGSGIRLGSVWEGDYDIPVMLKTVKSDNADANDLANEQIPVMAGLSDVPLRQVADITPEWQYGQITRRCGIRTITVMADTERGINATQATNELKDKICMLLENHDSASELPRISYGGEVEQTDDKMPDVIEGLGVAIVIIFFILVIHFKRISTALLLLCCLSLCILGTSLGVLAMDIEFGITCFLGIVSLMGILVRNGIIMIDYAEELRMNEQLNVRNAILISSKRRMRPIFLTSAAASMGVIPMILGGSGLWMPMGTVIFFGTIISMFLILTVIPIAYWMVMRGSTKKRVLHNEYENY